MSSEPSTDDEVERVEHIFYCPQCDRGLRARLPWYVKSDQTHCGDCGSRGQFVPGAVDVTHVIEDALRDAGYKRHIANCTPRWAKGDEDEWGLMLEVQVWDGEHDTPEPE